MAGLRGQRGGGGFADRLGSSDHGGAGRASRAGTIGFGVIRPGASSVLRSALCLGVVARLRRQSGEHRSEGRNAGRMGPLYESGDECAGRSKQGRLSEKIRRDCGECQKQGDERPDCSRAPVRGRTVSVGLFSVVAHFNGGAGGQPRVRPARVYGTGHAQGGPENPRVDQSASHSDKQYAHGARAEQSL